MAEHSGPSDDIGGPMVEPDAKVSNLVIGRFSGINRYNIQYFCNSFNSVMLLVNRKLLPFCIYQS